MMQAFIYQHLVPTKDWTVLVPEKGRPRPAPQVVFGGKMPVRLTAGETTRLMAVAEKKIPADSIHLELSEPPDGITVEDIAPEGPGFVVTINADAQTIEPGLKGNLIFNAFRQWTTPASEDQPETTRRSALGLLPAVPFEVVAARKSTRSRD
jgi:hypothetical protein